MVGVRGGGGGILLVGGHLHQLLRAPHPPFALLWGPLVPPWPGGLLAEAAVGHLLLVGVGVPRFDILGAPLKHGGRLNSSTPVAVPGFVVHYEMCIQSLIPQVQDLRAGNLELQRSQQELSQAVGSTTGISQSYGDRMT